MATYAAFFRAVNVGKRRVKMADLRACAADLGLAGPETHLQSGNLVFDAGDKKADALARRIEAGFETRFGFRSEVTLMTAARLAKIVAATPFSVVEAPNPSWLLIQLAAEPVDSRSITRFRAGYDGPEQLRVRDGVLYVYYAESIGLSKLGEALSKAKLALPGTARNIKVAAAVSELAAARG